MKVTYTFHPTELESGSINIDHVSELPYILKHLYNAGYYNIEVIGDRKQDYIMYEDGDYYGVAYCTGIYTTMIKEDMTLNDAKQLAYRLKTKGDAHNDNQ